MSTPENTCSLDGFGPVPVVQPGSAAELGDVIRRAAADGQAVYPLGGRTMLGVGLPPTKPGVGIDLRRLDQVIDYPARDMTVTVQAGITVGKLQTLLRAENQQLPIDVPDAEQATLGGALAANVSGPRRLGLGTLRDCVIGISTVNDAGREVKAGGRVVKNVAGYDLCKLHVGAFGTLGVITQVTLKLRPLPEARRWLVVPCPPEMLGEVLDKLHESKTTPTALTLLNLAAYRALPQAEDDYLTWPLRWWLLAVGFEGNARAVDWQMTQLQESDLEENLRLLALPQNGPDADALLTHLVEFPRWPGARLTFKAAMLPQHVPAFCQTAGALPEKLLLQAHAGNGIVIGHVPGEPTLEQVQALLATLQESVTEGRGSLTVLRCPPEWKAAVPVWGQPRGDWWLMRVVKDKLDPGRLFNPGRFVNGI